MLILKKELKRIRMLEGINLRIFSKSIGMTDTKLAAIESMRGVAPQDFIQNILLKYPRYEESRSILEEALRVNQRIYTLKGSLDITNCRILYAIDCMSNTDKNVAIEKINDILNIT